MSGTRLGGPSGAETDVVVVGTGAAALVAAIAAHDGGARVRIVEKSESVGGTTAVSGGGIWMPQNHRMGELGIEDSRDEALTYIDIMTAGRTPEALLARFVDDGPAIVAGLERSTTLQLRPMSWPDYHPEMEGAKPSGRMLEPALFDTGVLGPWAERLRRPPVLGMPITLQESTVEWRPAYFPERFDPSVVQQRIAEHRVACGQALIAALLAGCLARGIEPELETSAKELVTGDGWVAGLVVERTGDAGGGGVVIPAPAVVLASGGFEWNPTLRTRFLAGPLTHPHSPPVNEGDGLLMAMDVGADLANMTETWWYPASHVPGDEYDGRPLARFVGIERTAPHSIIVNRFGERFVNEAANYNDMMKAFFSFDANEYLPRNLPCWVVFDHQYRSRYGVVTTRPGDPDPPWLFVHDSVVGLAKVAGIDPEGLLDTVERWNHQVREGRDRDFGRGSSAYDRFHGDPSAPHPNLGNIEEGPFYALPIYVGSVGTKGGPRVDADGRIQHVHDRSISGLYGAGNVIASPAGPAYYGGGTSIGMGIVWGHLAGAHAAAVRDDRRRDGAVVTETAPAPPLVGDRVRMYELMVLIRSCDERIRRGLSGGEFACTYWPATGQEAIAAALGTVLRIDDQLVTTYRGLHDQIAKGVPLGPLVAEILTRETGVNAGKGGAMHISYPTAGLVLSTGIVGSGLPIATGVGMALRLRGSEHVAVASFGDGATGTGSFHEAVNLAALWRLPVVLLCQNNRYAEMTPTAEAQPVETVAERAAAYGIPSVTVDGNDPDAVHGALSVAVDQARAGAGPTLVECTTFRLFGHYFGDPMRYIPPDELEAARQAEPVARYRSALLAEGVLTEEIAEEVERQARDEVEAAFTEALAAEMPSELAATIDVYGEAGAGGGGSAGGGDGGAAGDGVTTMSMREALNRALDRALAADPDIVLIGEDIADPGGGISQVTKGLSTTHGAERVRDTPISEAAIVGAAVGAAASGLRPVAEVMIMDFVSIALDQLVNHAAKSRFMSGGRLAMPLTVRTAVFGGIGSGATHSQTLESWLAHIPGLKVVVPSTPADAMGLLTSCIFDDDPCVMVENVALYGTSGPVPDGDHRVPIGSAHVARPGNDVTIVTYGRTVRDALAAAEELAAEDVGVEVIDLRTLVPLDADTVLESVARTRRCVVAHHATRFAGFGAEVAGLVHEELFGELEAPVQRVGAAFAPIGSAATLEAAVMPSPASIADAVRETLGR